MYPRSSDSKILELLEERKQLSAKRNGRLLAVSKDTIRRDSLSLDQRQLSAGLMVVSFLKQRTGLHLSRPQSKGQQGKDCHGSKALQLIQKNGQVIFLDASTSIIAGRPA